MTDTTELRGLDPFDLMDTEAGRLAAFFSSLDDDGWTADTRCAGWRRRELVAHLAGADTYHLACVEDAIQELFAEAAQAGVTDVHGFNDWQVAKRADRPAADVLEEWRTLNATVRERMRALGPDANISTTVGPYPNGHQGFHLASEYATHADDIGAPVQPDEGDDRTSWRARVSRWAVLEAEKPVTIARSGDVNVVEGEGERAELSDAELVEAVSARLPEDHPLPDGLREGLRALA